MWLISIVKALEERLELQLSIKCEKIWKSYVVLEEGRIQDKYGIVIVSHEFISILQKNIK